ncbi:MAG: D-alanyl-D-alanine carboxypeptidase/D-alanyl-D-alanine-endopeptidase [Cyanobacteria bacterium P01_D01_bin.73]
MSTVIQQLGAIAMASVAGILHPIQVAGSVPDSHPSSVQPFETVATAANACKRSPQDYLNQMLEDPKLRRSHWGVLVQPLTAASDTTTPLPEPWLSHNAEQFFNPASNAKLITTAAALTQIGSNARTLTSLDLEQRPGQGSPNLWLLTWGDPTLNQEVLDQFAEAVAAADIKAIDTLWVRASDMGLATRGRISSWEWGDLAFGYGAPVSTAALNQNRMTLEITGVSVDEFTQLEVSDPIAGQQWIFHNRVVTTDANTPAAITITTGWDGILYLTGTIPAGTMDLTSIAVPEPAQYLGDSLWATLEQRSIEVGRVQVIHNSPDRSDLANLDIYVSPQLGELVHTTNQVSNNLYAEMLLGWLGLNWPHQERQPRQFLPSAQRSRQALEDALNQLGVEPNSYRVADGSGLSRQNLVTPQALVTLLNGMWRSPEDVTFQRSLPIAGETGTLRNRFKDPILEGRLIAKTGTLTGVSALSGYFPHGDRTWVAFSILVNHSNQPASVLRQAMDDLLVAIAETPIHCLGHQQSANREPHPSQLPQQLPLGVRSLMPRFANR